MLLGLKGIAEELGCTQNQLALAWVVKNRDVSCALFGAKSPEQVRDNLGALEYVNKISPSVLERIEQLIVNRPTPLTNFRDFTLRQPRR